VSKETSMARVAAAEAKNRRLQPKLPEKIFTVSYLSFVVFCVGTYFIKSILIWLGVIETIASPLTTVSATFLLLAGGAIILHRMLNRYIAKQELKKAKYDLSRYKHMGHLAYGLQGEGGGGFSNYRKNTTVLTNKQTTAQRREQAVEAAAMAKASTAKAAKRGSAH